MQRRDLLKDQIEQLGKVLAKMLDSFFNFKSNGQVGLGIQQTEQTLKEELGIDLDKLTRLSNYELKQFLEDRNYTNDHLQQLSELLFEYAQNDFNEGYLAQAKERLQLIEQMLDLNMDNDNSFSLTEGSLAVGISFENNQSMLSNQVEELLSRCD